MPPIKTESRNIEYHGKCVMKYPPKTALRAGVAMSAGTFLRGRDGLVEVVSNAVCAGVVYLGTGINNGEWVVYFRYLPDCQNKGRKS